MANAVSYGSALRNGHYASVLLSPASTPASESDAESLIQALIARLVASPTVPESSSSSQPPSRVQDVARVLAVGLAAFDAFLQSNVTGPILAESVSLETRFTKVWADAQPGSENANLGQLRKACLRYLEVDGVAPYAYIPHLELFTLAHFIITNLLNQVDQDTCEIQSDGPASKHSIAWTKLRINVWHYKLLTQPSLGPGSNFTRSSQWSDVPTLASTIVDGIETVQKQLFGEIWATDDSWTREEKAQFLVEAANNYILLGRDEKARETLREAAQTSGLLYALSGALGKRTKFQDKSTSQLVVLAKSGNESVDSDEQEEEAKPDALKLNDDTLLEEIQFTKEQNGNGATASQAALPQALADLSPESQPQLSPLDQIILLTEATLKDAFSPVDALTSEEILPFAVRVISDKSTNWQIYTQALLVRSRIEVHRSRTVERGVLQLQAVADQVLADATSEAAPKESEAESTAESDAPAIQVIAPEQSAPATQAPKATSFLPAPKASESAPAHVRLQYIHALSSPPRWHLESELAYAWAGVGSLASALEIFKRLRLWAEVALCLASSAASEDEDGRGSGGEEKATGIIRWRLFQRTGQEATASDADDENIEDVMHLKAADFKGPERTPTPPNAPRLWCILGDLEEDPAHWERAWEISKHRYARAQKSLGEYYLRQKDLSKAHAAYKQATAVNRLSPEMWGRLGDISLRLARFEDAAEAFSRSIGCATDTVGGEDARTWSNLGSALWSLYCEKTAEKKPEEKQPTSGDDEDEDAIAEKPSQKDPSTLLSQSLSAYKKGASIAHDNWRIWDNVLTLAAGMRPPAVPEMVLSLKQIIRIRNSEDALDTDILSAMLQDVVLSKEKESTSTTGIYEPPRGSMERLVARLFEEEIIPVITQRSELWALVSRLRGWRRDYVGAIDAAERAWRAAIGTSSSGLLPGAASGEVKSWTEDAQAFAVVVERTDELVSVLENWGPDVDTIGPKWKGKARNAVRSVMGRGKESWEGTDGWKVLEGLMEGLKSSS